MQKVSDQTNTTDLEQYRYAAWGEAMRIAYEQTALLRRVIAERKAKEVSHGI